MAGRAHGNPRGTSSRASEKDRRNQREVAVSARLGRGIDLHRDKKWSKSRIADKILQPAKFNFQINNKYLFSVQCVPGPIWDILILTKKIVI